MGAALVGSHVPANSDWVPPRDGVDIFVETNGVHVSLIVPMSAAGEDLSDLIRPDQLANPDLYGTHAIGSAMSPADHRVRAIQIGVSKMFWADEIAEVFASR